LDPNAWIGTGINMIEDPVPTMRGKGPGDRRDREDERKLDGLFACEPSTASLRGASMTADIDGRNARSYRGGQAMGG
jgi:hypothetical protein